MTQHYISQVDNIGLASLKTGSLEQFFPDFMGGTKIHRQPGLTKVSTIMALKATDRKSVSDDRILGTSSHEKALWPQLLRCLQKQSAPGVPSHHITRVSKSITDLELLLIQQDKSTGP